MAIGSGTSLMAKSFQEDYQFMGDLYVDDTREVYKFLHCKRGAKHALNLKAIAAIKTAFVQGYRQGGTQGDGMMLGGVFLISKDKIVWQHLEEHSGDHPSNDEILKEIKKF